MTRLGLWGARGDRRGLAIQSGEFARHMRPSKVMGFDLRGVRESTLPLDWSDFEHPETQLTVMHASKVTRELALDWMRGLDAVWACETWYQPDLFPAWAREVGVATIQHVNPEFYRYDMEPELPRPTLEIAPSSWRRDRMSGVKDVLPCPVPLDRLAFRERPLGEPLTFLHVIGVSAAQDRNGTEVVMEACRLVRTPCRLLVYHQGGAAPMAPGTRIGAVEVEYRYGDRPHYWTLYDEGDVLLMPRRYGGQCLPMQEAAACGIPTVMVDGPPQSTFHRWPTLNVRNRGSTSFRTQAGMVERMDPCPDAVAAVMELFCNEPWRVTGWGRQARTWAEERSWEALRPRYDAVLERAVRMIADGA